MAATPGYYEPLVYCPCNSLASVREFRAENGNLMRTTSCSRCSRVLTEVVSTRDQQRRGPVKDEWGKRLVCVIEGKE